MTRVRLYETTNSFDANLALAALLAAGVDAVSEANYLSTLMGDVGPGAFSVHLWVANDQVALARQVLADFERDRAGAAPAGKDWKCTQCGEPNGPAFEACWQCQTAREA